MQPEPPSTSHLSGLGCILLGIAGLLFPLVLVGYVLQGWFHTDGDAVISLNEEAVLRIPLRPSSAVSTTNLYLDPDAPLLFGASPAGAHAIFLRYVIELPPGSRVAHSDIVFRCSDNMDDRGTMEVQCKIEALDADDQPPITPRRYSSVDDLKAMPYQGESSISWEVDPWVGGETYASPDLSSLVEAFIARPGYRPGNCLGFRIRGIGSAPDSDGSAGSMRAVSGFGTGNSPVLRILLAEGED